MLDRTIHRCVASWSLCRVHTLSTLQLRNNLSTLSKVVSNFIYWLITLSNQDCMGRENKLMGNLKQKLHQFVRGQERDGNYLPLGWNSAQMWVSVPLSPSFLILSLSFFLFIPVFPFQALGDVGPCVNTCVHRNNVLSLHLYSSKFFIQAVSKQSIQ